MESSHEERNFKNVVESDYQDNKPEVLRDPRVNLVDVDIAFVPGPLYRMHVTLRFGSCALD